MPNILEYVKKYQDKSFIEEEFNDIDNLVFSLLVYIPFKKIKFTNGISLAEIGTNFINEYTEEYMSKISITHKQAYILLNEVIETKRYGNVKLYNYQYIGNEDTQFGACTFKYDDIFTYIAFEGTDDLIIGWKEDFDISCKFPTVSQKYAIRYLNKATLFNHKIYVGGHSKGGNLALVAGMYANPYIKRKIQKIYNNDGPGLRKKEFESLRFKSIVDKYTHIIPDYSYIGILFSSTNYQVVKSMRRDLLSHSIFNWEIQDKTLVQSNLNKTSSNFKEYFRVWLDNHTYKECERAVDIIFKILEKDNIKTTHDLFKISKLITLITEIPNVDGETRYLFTEYIMYIVKNIIKK